MRIGSPEETSEWICLDPKNSVGKPQRDDGNCRIKFYANPIGLAKRVAVQIEISATIF
jgi:hypothetical protein